MIAGREGRKKAVEQRALTAARNAGLPVPFGEVPGEQPDFRIQTPTGILGIEVSEVLRPDSANDGISPLAQENFHKSIMRKAQKIFDKLGETSVHVSASFSRAQGRKQSGQPMTEELVRCVTANRHRANPAVVLSGKEVPEGFFHILIATDRPSVAWASGECGGITFEQIKAQLSACITSKNELVSSYRANLPKDAGVWLLLYTGASVARSVPIPYGLDQWEFPFDFDRVFWYFCLENRVVEIQRKN